MFLDGVVLLDHPHCPPLNLPLNELDFVNHLLNLNHLDHLFLLSLRPVHVFLNRARLLNDGHSRSALLLLPHDNLGLHSFLFPHDRFRLFHRLQLIFDLLFTLGLLLEHESLNSRLKWAEDLLLAPHSFHLPLGPLPGSVLILCMDVAVPVAMHGIGETFDGAALVALAGGAASSCLGFGPEGAYLVVAAAATAGRLARASALAGLISTGLPVVTDLGTVGNGEIFAGGRPLRPSVSVFTLDFANEGISDLKVEGFFQEVVHV